MRNFILIMFLLMVSISANASVNNDLSKFFDQVGITTNTTEPHAYESQRAGYYSGGSLFARTSVRNAQIASVQLPSYRSGCNGIDLYTGGIQFIKSKDLENVLQTIMSNGASYALMLALEQATPQIANTLKYFNDIAQKINQANINSCETAASLVGSFWPKTEVSQRHVCADIGTKQGIFDDYSSARQGCGAGGDASKVLSGASGVYKNMVIDNGNLAWKAAQLNDFLKSDVELAELFMSLSGSILIIKDGNNDDANYKITNLESVADDKLIHGLLKGGQVNIYVCDETEKCLNPSKREINISENSALVPKTKAILSEIVRKIYADEALNDTEKGFLESTRLPIYKMLNVETAYSPDQKAIDVENYAEVIAIDILYQYLSENLSLMRTSSNVLPYPEHVISKYEKGIDRAEDVVRVAQDNAYKNVALSVQLITQTQAIEKILAGQLSMQLSQTLSWANGLT